MKSKKSLTQKYLINGPNNVVRLTNGTKILYIFGDYHLDPQMQNECYYNKDMDSIDFDKLLSKFIRKEKEKQFDIFLEIIPQRFIPNKDNYRTRYIDTMMNFIKNRLSKDNNVVNINPEYPNIRFHYMDIRHNILFFEKIFFYMNDYFYNNGEHIYLNQDYYFHAITWLKELIEIINIVKRNIINKSDTLVSKIFDKYTHSNIKTRINNIIDEIFLKNIDLLIKQINELIELYRTNNKDNDERIINYIKKIDLTCKDMFTLLTDLYFIRRFLDKDYISNGILYTGSAHMADIVYLLVKYFDFKITNLHYVNKKFNINTIKNIETKEFYYISVIADNLQNFFDYKTYQCINLFDFPPNFS